MKREIRKTEDGSVTIYLPEWEESYHSRHGAIQEAKHVFIKNGLEIAIEKLNTEKLSVLEIGFGTGLNAVITWNEAIKRKIEINYTTLEAFPISNDEVSQLNYAYELGFPQELFLKLHSCAWEKELKFDDNFKFLKRNIDFKAFTEDSKYDLIYFDAFGYTVQPELWSASIFKVMYDVLKSNGILTTYACRNPIKKSMETAGFKVFKVPGPPGKREMIIALKNVN